MVADKGCQRQVTHKPSPIHHLGTRKEEERYNYIVFTIPFCSVHFHSLVQENLPSLPHDGLRIHKLSSQ
jgi:hypothetical protein